MWMKIRLFLIMLFFGITLFAMDLNQKVSVNFKDADVSTVIFTLSRLSNTNIILPKELKGNVTLNLREVPLRIVIESIAKQFGLQYEVKDEVVYFYKGFDTNTASLIDFFYTPKNINIDSLEKILKHFVSEKGKIIKNDYNGTLIITDTSSRIEKIKELLPKIDSPIRQVMIEAKIVEVSKSGSKELGIQWSANINKSSTSYDFPHTINIGGGTSGYMVNLPVTEPAGTLGILLGNYSGSFLLDAKLHALEVEGLAKIVSQPKIVTMNNREATIESGEEIRYKVIDNDDTNVESDDAKLSLKVTPQITPDNNILLKIEVEKSDFDFSKTVDGYPLKFTRKAETYVKLKDGETTVIGGLVQETQSKSVKAVPGLSRIPLLGWLFKSKSKTNDLNDLIIFITPRIVRDKK